MNRYKYTGNLNKGRTSEAARQAFLDMRGEKITEAWYDFTVDPDERTILHVILTEEMLGIELN